MDENRDSLGTDKTAATAKPPETPQGDAQAPQEAKAARTAPKAPRAAQRPRGASQDDTPSAETAPVGLSLHGGNASPIFRSEEAPYQTPASETREGGVFGIAETRFQDGRRVEVIRYVDAEGRETAPPQA